MVFKTTLLTFIHGFKGDDDTFGDFPQHLKDLAREDAGSYHSIEVRVYPRYETVGDLPGAVVKFRDWLVEQVLSLEKAAGNASPIKSPTVGVILVGHSMGALVASDALFSFLDDINGDEEDKQRLEETLETDEQKADLQADRQGMFPAIQGVLAFDTPFCGVSRAMFAYGAFAQYQQISSAYGLVSSLSSLRLPTTTSSASDAATAADSVGQSASATASVDSGSDNKPAWMLWQAIAMRTGSAGAIAAAGAAAYMYRNEIGQGLGYLNRENISKGLSSVNSENIKQMFSSVSSENIQQGLAYISRENLSHGLAWLSGHLQFAGALMRGQEMQDRIGRLSALEGAGFADLYTSLGPNSYWSGGYFVAERTFCAVPPEKTEPNKYYFREVNSKAKDEIEAHTNMFDKRKNPGYEDMSQRAKGLVLSWTRSYEAKIQDPYPERRRLQIKLQIEAQQEAERRKAKYPGLTKYSYGEQRGLQETKAPSWIPSMPKTGYPTMPSYPSMPTYKGVSQYMPSMSWKKSEQAAPGSEEMAAQGGAEAKTEGDAPADPATTGALSADAEPSQTIAEEAAEHPLPPEVDDDNDLMATLKRTNSVPGVTEDLVFQLADGQSTTDAVAESQPQELTDERVEMTSEGAAEGEGSMAL